MDLKSKRTLWIIDNLWPDDLCDELVSQFSPKVNTATIGDTEETSTTDARVRDSNVYFIDPYRDHPELCRSIQQTFTRVNASAFGVNLYNDVGLNQVQFTQYTVGGHYDWHFDVLSDELHQDRKLSMSVQLTDGDSYEGGDLKFHGVGSDPELEARLRKKGTAVVFPSYLHHKVEPLTSGTRHTLVSWCTGPKWR